MKNIKFSRLFAAFAFVAILTLAGCKPVTEEVIKEVEVTKETTVEKEKTIVVRPVCADDGIIGNWISNFGEKYAITETDYDNYSHYDENFQFDSENWYLFYSTNKLAIKEINSQSGFIYGKFDDSNHIGSGATLGQWYALYYSDLSSSSVKMHQAYKTGGKGGCDTLEEAVTEFTLANGYYDLSNPSECTK